jgi:hypothetical protein
MSQQISPAEARAALEQIDSLTQRSEEFIGYWRQGVFVQIWGVAWMVAHLLLYSFPSRPGSVWLACDAAAVAGCVAVRLWARRAGRTSARTDPRLLWAMLIVALFGVLTTFLLAPTARAVELFWTCLPMCAYMVGGLWGGKRWIILGGAVCTVSVLSSAFLGSGYHLAMACAAGGGLLLGGAWLRHAGGFRAG